MGLTARAPSVQVYAEEKSRINDLLEELSQVREREALAIEERTRLEETVPPPRALALLYFPRLPV